MKRKIAVLALIETEVEIPDESYRFMAISTEMTKQAKALLTRPEESEILNIWSCNEDQALPKETIDKLKQAIYDYNKGEL